MSHFRRLLSEKTHSLFLPTEHTEAIKKLVKKSQAGGGDTNRAFFDRQVDFWGFSIATAVALDLSPIEESPSKRGTKFIDTKALDLPDHLCDLLAMLVLNHFGAEHDGLEDPKEMVDLGNRLAAAGTPEVIRELMDVDLSTTPLDRALDLVQNLRAKVIEPEVSS